MNRIGMTQKYKANSRSYSRKAFRLTFNVLQKA